MIRIERRGSCPARYGESVKDFFLTEWLTRTFHHFINFLPDSFSADFLCEAILNCLKLGSLLQVGVYFKTEPACEANASYHAQGIVQEGFTWRQWCPNNTIL
jgi:hypothetical protein